MGIGARDDRSRSTLLVAEDYEENRECLSLLFAACGYVVVAAGDGQQAIDLLRSGIRPALLLLDLCLPVRSGFDVLREIRQDPSLADLPVVAFSSEPVLGRQVLELGADEFLVKPVPIDVLVDTVRRYAPASA